MHPLLLSLFLVPGAQEARQERVADFRPFVAEPTRVEAQPVHLQRVTTAVPWPRGLVIVDGRLIALARGRHRNAGGIDPAVADQCGTLFEIDPSFAEDVIRSEQAGRDVRTNARILAIPDPATHRLYDPSLENALAATTIDRPYCTLAYDAASQNLFICGYSGVDLPGKRFRKNASDSILRYDLRDERWHVVEQHDPAAVPAGELGYVVSNDTYPHHDPAANPAPHGLLNGPDGGLVVGHRFYAVGKDNHALAAYDLTEIRRDPAAGAPAAELLLGRDVRVSLAGRVQAIEALGPSALEARDGYLYVGYRTSSIVLRFPIHEDGGLVQPVIGELVAVFEPWDPEGGRSGNLIDLAFDSRGELHVAMAQHGRVWNLGRPDPGNVFDGVDFVPESASGGAAPTRNVPFVDLPALTGNPRARCGNITFDADDNLYLCSGNYDSGTELAGVVYRVLRAD